VLYVLWAAILAANAINLEHHAARAESEATSSKPIFIANWANSFNSVLLKFLVV
jgi:hypothetical protein